MEDNSSGRRWNGRGGEGGRWKTKEGEDGGVAEGGRWKTKVGEDGGVREEEKVNMKRKVIVEEQE